jgi:hypothetical protein
MAGLMGSEYDPLAPTLDNAKYRKELERKRRQGIFSFMADDPALQGLGLVPFPPAQAIAAGVQALPFITGEKTVAEALKGNADNAILPQIAAGVIGAKYPVVSMVAKGRTAGKLVKKQLESDPAAAPGDLPAMPQQSTGNFIADASLLAPSDLQKERAKEVAIRSKAETIKGRMVGGPPDISTPKQVDALVKDYAARIAQAEASGVPRGYFYQRGADFNRAVTESPEDVHRLSMLQGVTSQSAPVDMNLGWAIRGMEQGAQGAPIATGLYPNSMSPKTTAAFNLDDQYIGHKTQRYAHGLMDQRGLAPNDIWEARSMGYGKDTPGPTQTAFMDDVRARAIAAYNKAHPDLPPLDTLGGQELNWAVARGADVQPGTAPFQIRKQVAGTPPEAFRAAAEGWPDVEGKFRIQHSWETAPGANLGHAPEVAQDPALTQRYFSNVKGAIIDPTTGKDSLVSAMGGRLQQPAFDGPGIFGGKVTPGVQSQSYGYHTSAGFDPTTDARVNATEALRAWALGQDAYAYHNVARPANLPASKVDTIDIRTGKTLPPELGLPVQSIADSIGGAIVPTPQGYRILDIGGNATAPGKNFAKRFDAVSRDLEAVTPYSEPPAAGVRGPTSKYAEIPWNQGPASGTSYMLEQLNNPAAPKLREHADSEATRRVMGELYSRYHEMAGNGELTPHPGLMQGLKAWAEGGLPALEKLVKAGTVPATIWALMPPQADLPPTQ